MVANSDWTSIASKIAMVWIEAGTDGNTDLLEALANDVNSMITVNSLTNCNELLMDDCVPYFKGIDRRDLISFQTHLDS